jgi:xanthine/uracil permease
VAGASGLSSAQSAMLIQSAMIIAGIGTLIQPIVAMLKYVAPVCLLLILLFAVSEALGIIKV